MFDCRCKMSEYRLRRTDANNLAIERKRVPKGETEIEKWTVIFYCGNNLKSLARGLLEIVLADYEPEDTNLLDVVESLELELVSGLDRIEKIAKEIVDEI